MIRAVGARLEPPSTIGGASPFLRLESSCLPYQPGDVMRIGKSLFVCTCGRTKRCELNDRCSELTFRMGPCVVKFTSGPGRTWPTSALSFNLCSRRPQPHPTMLRCLWEGGAGCVRPLAFFFNTGICFKYHVNGCLCSEADVWIPEPFHAEVPTDWWDKEADKSLLIGVFKHGKGRLCWTTS